MGSYWISVGFALFCFFSVASSQDDDAKPTFPPVFQAEMQGVFQTDGERAREMDGSLYYDSRENMAALRYTYQNQTFYNVYRFADDQLLQVDGSECTVSPLKNEGSFFPYTSDGDEKKTLAKPEDIFYFKNSTLDKETLNLLPSYVYKAKMDFPQFRRSGCDVMHVFSKPELELPDCDSPSCRPTLMTISIKCPANGDDGEMTHVYNFFRFRSSIADRGVFQPPVGVHCAAKSHLKFPGLPSYYSFSYDVTEKRMYEEGPAGLYSTHKKIWFDSQLKVIRMDEFDDDGLLMSLRVFDFWRGTAYTVVASTMASCSQGPLGATLRMDEVSRLPTVFFNPRAAEEGAVYVGKRKVHNFDYHVWTSSKKDRQSDDRIVEEFYFKEAVATVLKEKYTVMQISHLDVYIYERNSNTNEFELSILDHFSINHFRSKPKEWEAFDVAACFDRNSKRSFRLKVKGPPVIRESHQYEEVLELLYMNLIHATGMSVVRISELAGVFDGVEISAFSGWLLEKFSQPSETKVEEPDIDEAYDLIQKAAKSGNLSVSLNWDGKKLSYVIRPDDDTGDGKDDLPKPTFPQVFQVEVQGVFQGKGGEPSSEMEGTMYYDGPNDRAAMVFTFHNETTVSIYDFDDNELMLVEGNACTVSAIADEDPTMIFPFTTTGSDGKTILARPEELFYFTESTLDRQDISIFPYYVYQGKVDIPRYGYKGCEVSHVFSKPEVEIPTCEGRACKPTLVSIAIRCPSTSADEDDGFDHAYSFFRFRRSIADPFSAFQAPVGVHCGGKNHKPFPLLPNYFSFSYDLAKEQEISGSDSGVYSVHKKIWYESKVDLVRMDEIDDDGLLTTTRVFDYYGGAAYTVIASLSDCESGPIQSPASKELELSRLTRLPKTLFANSTASAKDAIYVGTRNARGLDYEVWSASFSYEDSYTVNVEEFYFTKNIPTKVGAENEFFYQISHADIYTYVRNEDTKAFELSLLTHVSISNFRSKLKEWEAFDVSLCYDMQHRIGFRIKMKGPAIIKESLSYHEIYERLLMKLIATTYVNILRINELQGEFDGSGISEFTGWILEKSEVGGPNRPPEPDMKEAFRIIKDSVAFGNFSIKVKTASGEKVEYLFDSFEEISAEEVGKKQLKLSGYSGSSMAGMGLACLSLGFIVGILGYYVFLKKRRREQFLHAPLPSSREVELNNIK